MKNIEQLELSDEDMIDQAIERRYSAPTKASKKKRTAFTKLDVVKSYRLILVVLLVLDIVQRVNQHDEYSKAIAAGAVLACAESVYKAVYSRK